MAFDIETIKDYTYKNVTFLRNYDGDTIDFVIRKAVDIGFGVVVSGSFKIKVRLFGVDTPELRASSQEEREMGYKARDFVRAKLHEYNQRKEIILVSIKDKKGKYGRYLGKVYLGKVTEESCLNSILLKEGLAKEYGK